MKLSVNRRPAMGNTPIVINDYQKEPHLVQYALTLKMPIGTQI